MFYILENLNVENIIIGIQADEYKNCKEFMNLAKRKKVKVFALKKGEKFKIDKNTYIDVLFPDINNIISENKINNNSLVFKLISKKVSILFTGDIEEEAENIIYKMYENTGKLKSDILKVAHHGSKTSSTERFINCVEPNIVLIGVGKNNTFGHPSEEVIKRYKNIRK